MTIPQFQKNILSWYKENRRDPRTRASTVRGRLPWRRTKDPYKVLVSEVMLQQTQVSRVLPKYKEFLREFPNLASLATASDARLLKVWAGLGYWRRAIFLRETAKKVLKDFKGRFPQNPKILQTFPGIGPYTARALACFAFGNSETFLDTNIRRVYLHFFFPKRKKVSDKEILKIAQRATPAPRSLGVGGWINPKEWHYALMDYGALVLKDKKINKRSRHYHKQSKFEGSFRSFRTKVMRFLLEQPNQTATRSKVRLLLKKTNSPYAPEKVLRALEKDGLIKRELSLIKLGT